MNIFIEAFNTILYKPLFNALVFLYEYLPGHDFGVAVIVLTLLIRIVLYPLMVKSIKSQKVLQGLQPKLKEIQQKYKDDKETQTKETMALYKKEKINPFGGCLPLLLQFPILIALYRVFWKGLLPGAMDSLYPFVSNPGTIDPNFLNVMNLGQPSIILAVLAGIAQFFQTKMTVPKTQKAKNEGGQTAQFSDMMQKQMLYFFPIFTVFIVWKLPSAIGLYWIVTSLFSIFQQYLIYKPQKESLIKPVAKS